MVLTFMFSPFPCSCTDNGVCFLAYVLWKMLSQLCWRADLGAEPRRVFEELSKIKVVDVPHASGSSPKCGVNSIEVIGRWWLHSLLN